MKSILIVLVKYWRWFLFLACILCGAFTHGFIRGAACVGFFWTAFSIWKVHLSNPSPLKDGKFYEDIITNK
jgi:hypothetical protein